MNNQTQQIHPVHNPVRFPDESMEKYRERQKLSKVIVAHYTNPYKRIHLVNLTSLRAQGFMV